MRRLVLVLGVLGVLGVLAACDPPSPALRLRLAEGPAQMCPSTDCADVPMFCKTWISIRFVDPGDPLSPYLSQCQEVPQNRKKDLCSVASVDLETKALPLRELEVQIALYPESMITFDPETGDGICPSDTQYDAVDGFPVESGLTPALGGRTFYRPGDETISVTLGCTNLEAINDDTCVGTASVAVTSTSFDFDRPQFSVSQAEADHMTLAVGEPQSSGNDFVLNASDVTPLARTAATSPAWSADVEGMFTTSACVTVLDDGPQSTTTMVCTPASVTTDELAIDSVRLSKASLDQILAAIPLTQFPAQGITIGLVLDSNGNPLGNRVVTAPLGSTILYLSADRNSVAGTATAGGPKGGVFVSLDAPYGTLFGTSGGTPVELLDGIGGRVAGKVTLVVLRFKGPIIGG